MELRLDNLLQIDTVAKEFVAAMGANKVFAFYGEMGAGKTTFIKAVCRELGVTETITSPTFSIINEYKKGDDESLFHFDFYRIESIQEAYDFGYEDYFFSGRLCFIEWPELVETLLPDDVVNVYITVDENNSRCIKIAS